MRRILILATIVAAAAAQAAGAATVLFDDFSGDAPALGVASLPNFTIGGTVDIVGASNPYGIVAPKNVIDLDGTPGPGSLTTASYGFAANSKVTLTFVLGGAQRGSVSDNFYAGFDFSTPTTINHYTLGGGYGTFDIGSFLTTNIITSSSIGGAAPFTTYSLSFTSGNAGSLDAFVGTSSADNVGPLLSSFQLDIGAVPEPATWTLMIGGFGLVGLGLRRRVGVAA